MSSKEKKAPTPEENSGPLTNRSKEYQSSSSKSIHLPQFSQKIKSKWVVKRDERGDEFIRLNGKNALLNEGLDHIYLISEDLVGVWLTTRQIESRVRRLKKIVPGLTIQQLGDTEGVLSCSIEHLDDLCKAVGAQQRRTVSDETRERLRRINPQLKHPKSSTDKPSQGPNEPEKQEDEQ